MREISKHLNDNVFYVQNVQFMALYLGKDLGYGVCKIQISRQVDVIGMKNEQNRQKWTWQTLKRKS